MKFSEDTLRRFARELVKYPPEHKQSAVMACMAIVQQEQGYVSTEAEDACQLREGQTALDHVCGRLGVEPYGTTADGVFTVQPSECLGACADAPVMLVNDRQMLSFMGHERLDELIDTLRAHVADESR